MYNLPQIPSLISLASASSPTSASSSDSGKAFCWLLRAHNADGWKLQIYPETLIGICRFTNSGNEVDSQRHRSQRQRVSSGNGLPLDKLLTRKNVLHLWQRSLVGRPLPGRVAAFGYLEPSRPSSGVPHQALNWTGRVCAPCLVGLHAGAGERQWSVPGVGGPEPHPASCLFFFC